MRDLYLPDTEEGSSEFKTWLAHHHGHEADVFPDNAYGYGIVDEGEIIVAIVIQPFHYPGDMLGQYYGDDPRVFFQKDLILRSFLLPFEDPFNARRITLVINGVHDRSIGVAKRMGFKEEGRMKYHFDNDEAVILGMIRPDLEA